MVKYKQIFLKIWLRLAILMLNVLAAPSFASDVVGLFPLEKYDQTISSWLKPSDPNFNKPLLSTDMQQKRMELFYDHYIGRLSPWSSDYIREVFRQQPPKDLKTLIQDLINQFNNQGKPIDKIGYGLNYRAYDQAWIQKISENINLAQFDHLTYQDTQRGIAVDNLQIRALPTDDNFYLSYKIAGEGYPFDYLQWSTLWVGTPVYILGESRDRAWMLVVTPEVIGWVKSKGIAYADNDFVNFWIRASKKQLIAVMRTATSLLDEQGRFLLSTYVGSVFPGEHRTANFRIMLPIADDKHQAKIKWVNIASSDAAAMPLSMTPQHFSELFSTLIGRTYGWGGMQFLNDCSAELKSLFTPFGIWLPRNSSQQANAGKIINLDQETPEKRLAYLMKNGLPFLTLVHIKGHIFLYIGNYPDPNNKNVPMAMTYQNAWALSPNPPERRAIIGKSVLFPLLLKYPEDPTLESHAAKKEFQLIFLNELPSENDSILKNSIDLKTLLYPENSQYLMISSLNPRTN